MFHPLAFVFAAFSTATTTHYGCLAESRSCGRLKLIIKLSSFLGYWCVYRWHPRECQITQNGRKTIEWIESNQSWYQNHIRGHDGVIGTTHGSYFNDLQRRTHLFLKISLIKVEHWFLFFFFLVYWYQHLNGFCLKKFISRELFFLRWKCWIKKRECLKVIF